MWDRGNSCATGRHADHHSHVGKQHDYILMVKMQILEDNLAIPRCIPNKNLYICSPKGKNEQEHS